MADLIRSNSQLDRPVTEVGHAPNHGPATNEAVPATSPPVIDQATVTRMQQELARSRKALETIGIDPDSSAVDAVGQGMVDINALKRMQQTSEMPPSSGDPLSDLIARVERGEPITPADYAQHLKAIQASIAGVKQEYSQQFQSQQVQNTMSQCIDATLNVLRDDPGYLNLPEDLRPQMEQMFLATVDNLVADEGRRAGNPSAFMTPKTYGFYAAKAIGNLAQVRNAWSGSVPTANRGIKPISPQSGTAPTLQRPAVNRHNWQQRAYEYAQRSGQA